MGSAGGRQSSNQVRDTLWLSGRNFWSPPTFYDGTVNVRDNIKAAEANPFSIFFFFLHTLIKKWTLLVKYSAQLNFRGWSSGTEWFSTAGFSFYAKLRQRASYLDGRVLGKLQQKKCLRSAIFFFYVSLPNAVLLCCPFSFWRTHPWSLDLQCLLEDETFQILQPLLWRWTSKLWKTKPCPQFSAEEF